MSETPQAAESRHQAQARPGRWLLLLLIASLAFNLVVIGAAVAERVWPQRAEQMSTPRATELLPRRFFSDLDRERRAELRAIFRTHRQAFRDERRVLRDAAQAVADALAKEPYDPALVRSAITDYGVTSHKLVDLGLAVAGDLVEKLGPEERQALSEHIRKRATPPRRSSKEK